jgi:alpha-galactosidase
MSNTYRSVYLTEGENPVFCYRSGMTVHEETLCCGLLISSGYNGAGYPLNVLTNCSTRIDPYAFAEASAFQLEIDGCGIERGLVYVDFKTEETESKTVATLTLDSTVKPVRLHVITEIDGTAMFTRRLVIENRSDKPQSISRLAILSGGLETLDLTPLSEDQKAEDVYSIGYFEQEIWCREGEFTWKPLGAETTVIDTRFGRERYRHPMLFLRNNLLGKIYFVQTAWTGGCRFAVDNFTRSEYRYASLSLSAEILGYKPLTVLEPHESYTTPAVHMGMVQGDLDDAVNEMHAHIRTSVLNRPETDPTPCLVGGGMGAEHDMSLETTKAFMRQLAEMGAEVFIIDAGWVCPPGREQEWWTHNGINVPDADRYPNGIGELRDYCHSLGMRFGMWVEIERLGPLAETRNQHPDWFSHNTYGAPTDGLIDLTVPEAAAWAEEELARIITEYGLDLLRIDYNVASNAVFTFRDLGTGIAEFQPLRHYDAVYRLYGNLKRRFPTVLFENCAGGGGRSDLGMMQNFHHTWVSDCQKMPHSLLITNGMTMALPPERVDRLFAGMGCHEFGTLAAHMRNTMLGHISLNVIAPAATEPNPIAMAFVKHSIEVYKSFIRPILPTCKVYHHTPDTHEIWKRGFYALEIAAPNGDRGALTAFTVTNAKESTFTVIPRGIDPTAVYRVTFDNHRATMLLGGYDLATNGIRISLPSALSSDLVLYERVEHDPPHKS